MGKKEVNLIAIRMTGRRMRSILYVQTSGVKEEDVENEKQRETN